MYEPVVESKWEKILYWKLLLKTASIWTVLKDYLGELLQEVEYSVVTNYSTYFPDSDWLKEHV